MTDEIPQPLTDDEYRTFNRLLWRHASTGLDQWDMWKVAIPRGTAYIDISRKPAPGASKDAYTTVELPPEPTAEYMGTIPIDMATLMIVDPLYVEEYWVRIREAANGDLRYGPSLDGTKLGEALAAEGHDVTWVNPIEFIAAPATGMSHEQLLDRARTVWRGLNPGAPDGSESRRVQLTRPMATLWRLDDGLIDLNPGRAGRPLAAVASLGSDGEAGVTFFRDAEGLVTRIVVDFPPSSEK